MSFSVYGTDCSYKEIIADDIDEAYETFISTMSKYMLKNYKYKIERLY